MEGVIHNGTDAPPSGPDSTREVVFAGFIGNAAFSLVLSESYLRERGLPEESKERA